MPTADAGADQSAGVGELVTLNARESNDPEGDVLAYSWRQIEGPGVVLTDGVGATTSFNAPSVTSATNLRFLVTVTDEAGNASTDTVVVTVAAPAPGGGGAGGSSSGGGALAPFELVLLLGIAGLRKAHWRNPGDATGRPEGAGPPFRGVHRFPSSAVRFLR
jgi:hypothetical protein